VVREVSTCGETERVGTAVVQFAALDALVIGDEERPAFIEYPVVGQRSLAALSRGPESVEHAQVVERLQSSSRASRFREVQTADLVGRQDVMLVAVQGDTPVAFRDVRGQEQSVIVGQTASPPPGGRLIQFLSLSPHRVFLRRAVVSRYGAFLDDRGHRA
jgi:hypothetical protein